MRVFEAARSKQLIESAKISSEVDDVAQLHRLADRLKAIRLKTASKVREAPFHGNVLAGLLPRSSFTKGPSK